MANGKPKLQFDPQPVTITVDGIKCLGESDESSASDEIYVLVTAVDLTVQPIPNVRTIKTGVWGDVDKGEFHAALQLPPGTDAQLFDTLENIVVVARPFWGFDLNPRVIHHPNDVIFLVTCMEHDDSGPGNVREMAQMAATAAVASSIGLPRATLVQNLRHDIDDAINTVTDIPIQNDDERINRTKELRLNATHVAKTIPTGQQFFESLFFYESDEGHYRVDFRFRT
jgi:hypothetical protein